MKYTLDTNILVNLNRLYPKDIFPAMWKNIESSISAGETCICEAILREIHRGGDALHKWAKGLKGFVCPTSDCEILTVARIANDYPGWVQGQKNEADPFIVAHAYEERSTIVTEETRKGPNTADRNQKVPNVADAYNVASMNFFEYVRSYGWTF